MKHIIFYSGGIGSWYATKRVIEQHGKENVILLFTDTLMEDEDLYRFIEETVKKFDVEYVDISDGRSPWEVFHDVNFLGNSRIAHCSKILKQDLAKKWIYKNYKPNECVLYLGIDWSESHRRSAPIKGYHPYTVKFPMCDAPYLTKDEMLNELSNEGIEIPYLYKLGFSHNNCGGFCVKAGFGHFEKLYKELPERYLEHEENERHIREKIGKDVTILKRSKVVKKYNPSGTMYKDREIEKVTLKQLRKEIEANNYTDIDVNDVGGCGCFVEEE